MKERDTGIERIRLFVVLVVVATIILVLLIPVIAGVDFGDYGSFIGGLLGTSIGGVTVYLVYRTYMLQKSELELSREELKLTRKELEMTRGQIVIQNFETTFFNLVEMFSKIREDVKGSNDNSNDAFQDAINQMKLLYRGSPSAYRELDDVIFGMAVHMHILLKGKFESKLAEYHFRQELGPQKVLAIFNQFKDIPKFEALLVSWIGSYIENTFFQKRLTNYYSSMAIVIHYIHSSFPSKSNSDSENKEKYFSIFYSTLSAYEKILLFYYVHDLDKRMDKVVLRKFYIDFQLAFGIDDELLMSKKQASEYSHKLFDEMYRR